MSENVRGELLEPSRTKSFKATLMIDYLTERIKDFPGDYHKFVKIVKKLGPWAKDMAEHLDQTYAKNLKGTMSLCNPYAYYYYLLSVLLVSKHMRKYRAYYLLNAYTQLLVINTPY